MTNFSAGTQSKATAKTTNAQIVSARRNAYMAFFSFVSKKRLRMSLACLLLVLISALGNSAFGQSTANYAFANGVTGSLALDLNGNAVDLTTGATSLVAAGSDDSPSPNSALPFEFWMNGVRYISFSASDNGVLQLFTVASGTESSTQYTIASSGIALIAPFANDMRVGTDGNVRYKTVGTAPNRCLVIEWSNNMIRYLGTAAAGTATFQARVYETTGVIEFMYGTMTTNSAGTTAYNVGFSVNNTLNNVLSVNTTSTVTSTAAAAISNTYTASSTITQLNSVSNGSRINYKFTPPMPAAPTAMNFTGIGAGGMTVNWTDNASNEVGYVIYRSTDGITYTYVTQIAAVAGTGGTGSYAATGLSASTTYYWKVSAVSEGGVSSALSGSQATAACGMTGTFSIGPTGGTYPTITAALAAVTSGGLSGPVNLEIQTTYTGAGETYPITIGSIPCSPTYTVTIRPQGTVSVSGSSATSIFDLNGCSAIVIDGRVGSTGTTKSLTISNTGTGSAIRLINDASGNMVEYCTIKSVETSTTNGTILFSTAVTTGSDNNTIDNCDILDGATTPFNGIVSIGTSGKENDHNTVSNCNIANFFSAGSATTGITMGTGSSDWTISNNKFYQTTVPRVYTTGNTHRAIYVNNTATGNNFNITGNTIGYSSSSATGTYSMTGTIATVFRGIEVNAGTTTASSVQNNTITALNLVSNTGSIAGIVVTAGSVNVGTTTPNTIGAASGTGAIFTSNSSSTNPAITGISCAASGAGSIVTIANNIIASLTTTTTVVSAGAGITGISLSSSGTYSVSGNTIGGSTANSINASQAVNAAVAQNTYGIQNSSGAAALTISNNTIKNINNSGTSTSTFANGMFINGGATNSLISGNNISNIGSASAVTTLTGQTGTAGIAFTASITSPVITQNTINAISSSNGGAVQAQVTGIYFGSATTATISRNRIYDIRNASTMTVATTPPTADGIIVGSGTNPTIVNNMISLGNGSTTNTAFSGILNTGTASTLKVYYNTVNIEGTAASGALATACFNRGNYTTTAVTTTMDIQNNLFTNTRSGGTGLHYAIANGVNVVASSATGWSGTASNYNILDASVAANVGYWSGSKTFATWKSTSLGDANSQSAVAVTYANSATGDLHMNMGLTSNGIESHGVVIAGFTTDFDNDTRPGPVGSINGGASAPDVGADEFDGVPIDNLAPVMTYTALGVACTTGDRTLAVTIVDASGVPAGGSGTEPRIYYRNGAGSWFNHAGTLTSGSLTNGVWTFTIVATDITPAIGNTISYYIISQDNLGNVGSNPSAGLVATNVNTVGTPPTTPNTYQIGITSGTYTVGVGQTFATITAAVNAYNSSTCISGPIVFSLTDAAYSASETFPITINANALASSTNTLTIRPASGVGVTVTGLSGSVAIFKMLNASYVTIDGVNTGGSSLTLTSANTGTAANIWLASTTGTGPGCNFINLKNMTINGGSITSTSGYGIIAGVNGASPSTTGGIDNDNVTIQGNTFLKCYYGIYANGTAAVSAGGLDNWNISSNIIGPATSGANSLGGSGIFLQNALNATITGNTIQNSITTAGSIGAIYLNSNVNGFTVSQNTITNITSTASSSGINSITSLFMGNAVINGTVSRNTITSIASTTSSGYGVRAIILNTGTNTTNTTISNNMLTDIWNFEDATAIYFPMGIDIDGSTGGLNIYFNSINLFGSHTGFTSSGGVSACIYSNTTGNNLDIRDNMLTNSYDNSSSGSDESYAIYSSSTISSYATIDYNDYYVSGTPGVLGFLTSDLTSLGAIQTAFGGNTHSINFSPTYVSATNLHLSPIGANVPLLGSGVTIGSVPTDIDGFTRVSPPVIGAHEFTLPPCVAPTNPPTGISFSSLSASGGTVNFTNASPTPTGYIVVQSIGALLGTPAATLVPTVGATCCTNGVIVAVGSGTPLVPVATLNPNSSYQESVFDYNNTACAGGPLYNATSASGSLLTCPAAPTAIVNGAIDDASIAITWTAPTGGATSYTVLVYTDAGLSSLAPGYTVSYSAGTAATINGLSAVTQYWYTVTAVNASCNSVPSVSQTGTTLDHPCSSMPTAGTATSTTGIAATPTVFTLSLTGGTAAVGVTYQWESSPDGSSWTPVSGATTYSYNYTGLTANTFFHCVVTCTLVSMSATSTSVEVLYESCVPSAASWANGPVVVSFNPTGSLQTWTVPAGVTTVSIDAQGAKGGGFTGFDTYGSNGGFGGRVQATMNVTPAHVLNVVVATPGADGGGAAGYAGGGADLTFSAFWPGSAGGGYSSITDNTTSTLLLVAGGGGGGGGDLSGEDAGGQGGGLIAGNGDHAGVTGAGGHGGNTTTLTGGSGSTPGTSLQGGNNSATDGAGGGGGGFYGGGAGTANGGGGGGGSSYTNGGFTVGTAVHTPGFNSSATGGVVAFNYTLANESALLGINTFSISASPGPSLVDVNMVAAAGAGTGFVDRTGMTPATLYNGATYPASITWGSASSYQEAQVWIDFNNDGIFSSSEEVTGVVGYNATSTPNPTSFAITIPSGAATGTHLMRIRGIKESASGTLALSAHLDPCLTQYGGAGPVADHGDVADYYVTIVPIPPCAGIPSAGTGNVSPSSGNSSTPFTVSISGYTVAGGISEQWQSSPDNTTWSDITGATTSIYSFVGISHDTYYRCNVTCSVSALTAVTTNTVLATFVLPAPSCTPTAGSWTGGDESFYELYGASGFTVTGYSGSNLNDPDILTFVSTTTGYALRTGSIPAVDMLQNASYPASITWGIPADEQQTQVWIDFNDNGTFETSEEVTAVAGYDPSFTASTTFTNITIPMTATPGRHLMRMRAEWDDFLSSAPATHLDPCLVQYLATDPQYFGGTVTDYAANILCNTPAISGVLSACSAGGTTALSDIQGGGLWGSSNTSVATIGTDGVVIAAASGTTTITYTIASTGCSTTATLTVASAPSAIAGSSFVCSGQTITLSDALGGGTWDNGGSAFATVGSSTGVVTGVSAGTTIITYTACSNSVYTTITTNITPSISGAIGLCTVGTSSVTLTGTPSGGTWVSADPSIAAVGSSSGVVTATGGGTTTISYTGTNGCVTTVSEVVNSIVPVLTVNASPATICAGGTTTLTATVSGVPNYVESGIAYAPVSFTPTGTFNNTTTPDGGGTTNDDSYYNISLPFNFTYFGTNYSAGGLASISTNGTLALGASYETVSMGTLPNGTTTDLISLFGRDMDLRTTGTITYGTTGVAPNRKFVVSYNAEPDYSSGGLETGQMVLYEGSNVIEFHVTTAQATTHTFGIQKSDGATAFAVPGQNNSPTPISNGAYRFSPIVVNYAWSPSTFLGGTTGSSEVATAVTSTTIYTVMATNGACYTTATTAASINPAPAAISGGTSAFCVGATTTVSDAVTGGTWSSSDPTIATIDLSLNPATITGVSGGTATITYANVCGVTTTSVVTVNAAVITGSSVVCVSSTTTLTGAPAGGTWTSSVPANATIGSTDGLVSGLAVGTTVISYFAPNGCSNAFTETISNTPPPAISGGSSLFCASTSITLSDATSGGAWSSSDPSIASVVTTSPTVGTVTGVATTGGTATITYSNGCGTAPVLVVSVNPGPAPITGYSLVCVGQSISLSESVPGVTWGSTPAASVTGAGVVTGVSIGSATVTATLPSTGCFVTKTITVNSNAVLPSVTASAVPPAVCAGFSTELFTTASSTMQVTSIPYSYVTASIATGLSSDDASVTLTLPFPVSLFGSSYTTAYVDVNGFISFGSSTSGSNYTAVAFPSANAPASGAPQAMVAPFWHDMRDDGTSGFGNITYDVIGVSPNRKYVVSWNGVWDFSTTAPQGISTGEVIFYEGQTYIDVMVTSAGNGGNNYNMSCGLQNAGGTQGVNAPGENGVHYNATNEGWRFYNPNFNYVWSPATFLSSTTAANPFVNVPTATTSYSVNVTDQTSGCQSVATATVSVNPIPTTAPTAAPACVGGTINLNANATFGATYLWNGPLGYTSTGATPAITGATTAMNGTYSVTVTSAFGCMISGSVVVTVNTLAITSGNDGPACVGGTVNLTSTPSGSATPTGYAWSGPALFSALTQNTNLTTSATTAMSGVYTITVTASGSGCTAISTTNVTINTLGITAANDGPACVGGTVNLTSTPSGSATPTGYSWSGPASFGAATQNTNLTTSATTAMTGVYTVVVTATGSGCTATNTTNVTINTLGVAAANDGPACIGGTINLTATPSGTETPTSYAWSGPLGYSTSTQNPLLTTSATTAMSGVYTVTTTGAGSGCSATSTTTVSIGTIGILASNDGPACLGGTINLIGTSTGSVAPATYQWSGPLGYTSTMQSPVLTTSATTDLAGVYTLVVTAGGAGCTATSTTTVVVGAIGVSAGNDGPACVGGTINLSSTPTGGVTAYSWHGPLGFTSALQNPAPISSIALGRAGVYTVTVSGAGSGCIATTTTNVVVNTLGISASNNSPTCVGLTTSLNSTPSGSATPTAYSWSGPLLFSAGTQNTLLTSVTTDMSGTYTVTVTAAGNGCTAFATTNVSIIALPQPITGNTSFCVGGTTTVSDVTTGGTWSSTNTGVATIGTAGLPTAPHTVSGLSAGTATISYTVGTGCATTLLITVNPNPVITGMTPVCVGSTVALSDNIPGGLWTAQNTKATVGSTSGIVTGVTFGTDNITYTLPTTCRAISVATINPLPSAIGGTARVCQGMTTTLNTTSSGGSWHSSNPSVATVGSTGGTTTVTGITAGSAVISYVLPTGCYTSVVVTVNALSPITGNAPVCQGSTLTLSDAAVGGTWVSSNTGIATVGSVSGVVSGVAGGTARISYTTFAGCLAVSIATVNPIAVINGNAGVCEGATTSLSDVTVGGTWISSSPANATVPSGVGTVTGVLAGTSTISYQITSTGCTATKVVTVSAAPGAITGTAVVCAGQTTALTDAVSGGTWISSAPAKATVGSTDGMVTGVAAGTSIISYKMTAGGCQSTRIVTVNTTPAAITGNVPVCQSATVLLHEGTGGGSWSTTDVAASVSATGLVTGLSGGTATITYGMPTGCQATAVVTVNPITPITGAAPVCVGSSVALTDATPGGTWSSSAPAKGTVDASGNVTGIAGGNTTITYLIAATGCKATVVETVNALPGVINGTKTVCAGGSSVHLSDVTAGGTWGEVDGSGSASIDGSGNVTGLSPGTATINYVVGGCGVSATITINASPALITGNTPTCAGSLLSLIESVGGGTWSSTTPSVATVNSSGVVTTVAGGTSTISYTTGAGCNTSVIVTVNTILPITGITSVCLGSTTNLADATLGGTWMSSDAGTASVGTSGIVTGNLVGTAIISYTAPSGCIRTTGVTVNPVPSAIAGTLSLCNGGTTTLSDDGSGSWSSLNTTVATVGAGTGIVTGASAGTATIKYTAGSGCFVSAVVTVNAGPSPIGGAASVCAGSSISVSDLMAGGAWSTADVTASVISTGSTTGSVTGISAGTAMITYTAPTGGCFVTRTIVINPVPAAISGNPVVCIGHVTFLSDATTPGVSWTSGTPSVATVSGSGAVTGVSGGTANITYSIGTGCNSSVTVTVTALPSSISGNTPLCPGNTMLLTDASTGGTWTSNNPAIASVGTDGTVTGVTGGNATITYTVNGGGCYATTVVTVTTITAINGASVVCTGTSITLSNASAGGTWSSADGTVSIATPSVGSVLGVSAGTATITYTFAGGGCAAMKVITVNTTPTAINGNALLCIGTQLMLTDDVTGGAWSSSNGAIAAVVGSTGVTTGMAAGTARITYALGGCSVNTTVTVNTASPVTGFSSICAGAIANMHNATSGGTWSSSNTATGTISAGGVLTGLAAGTTTVSYTLASGCVSTLTVTVNPVPDAITGNGAVCVGGSLALSDDITGGIWSSSNGVATVDGTTGMVTAVATGTSTITYTVAGCFTTTVVTVGATPAAISGPLTVCEGGTIILNDATLGGAWSSTTSNATIDASTGVVSGVTAGTTTISYTLAGCGSVTVDVTVNASPAALSGNMPMCIGSGITLGETTGGGAWSSSNGNATVDGSGNVSGIAAGTAIISYTAGSCSATTVVTVVGMPAAITGSSFVCVGGSTTLNDATPGGLWSSADATISIGTGTGVVTGVSIGTASVTYTTSTGCYATATITVNTATAPINGPSTVCVGSSTLYTDATGGGVWSSSTTSVATIATDGTVTGVAAGTTTLSYVTGGCISTMSITVSAAPSPITGPSSVCANSTIALSDATAGGTWTTGSGNISVDGSGNVTGISAGVGIVTYTSGSGCSVTKNINVNPQPTAINGLLTVCTGATTFLSDGTGGGVSWTSNTPSVATVSFSGAVLGVAPGTTTITYSITSGCYITAVVTVNALPAAISNNSAICQGASIVLTDATAGGTWSSNHTGIASTGTDGTLTGVSAGNATITYTVYGAGCYATTVATVNPAPNAGTITGSGIVCVGATTNLMDAASGGVWSSTTGSVATVNTSGVVLGVSAGTTTISYTVTNSCGTVAATMTVTVNALPVPGTITGSAPICAGTTLSLTNATAGGNWSSSNANATVDGSGTVTGVTGGTATISYTVTNGCGSASATTVVTINAIAPITGSLSMCAGFTTSLTDATTGGLWSSTNTAVATVGSTTGVVNGLTAGTSVISYVAPTGCTRAVTVTVTTSLPPITGTLAVCQTFTTALSDPTGGGVWTSGSPSIATVGGSTGIVTGSVAGTAHITYAVGGSCVAITTVTVNPQPSGIGGAAAVCNGSTITVSDPSAGGTWTSAGSVSAAATGTTATISTVSLGAGTVTYTLATGCYVSKTITVNDVPTAILGNLSVCGVGSVTFLSDATSGTSWVISPVGTATVSTSGRVYGVSPGTATVTYTGTNTCKTTAVVTVNALVTVPPISGATNVSSGATISLSDAMSGGVWTSSNSSIASVSLTGPTTADVTGVAVSGTVIITYTIAYPSSSGCTAIATKTISVHTPAPHAHGTTVAGTQVVFTGAIVNIVDETTDGIWSSSNTTIATVDGAGTVTGIAPGTANITHIVTYDDGEVATTITPVVVSVLPVDIRVVPNPNNGAFTIKGNLGTLQDEEVSLEVTDVLGQVVYSSKITTHGGKINEKVSLSGTLANGMYILNVHSGSEEKTFHFVIEK